MGNLWDFATSSPDIAPYLPEVPGHQRKYPDRAFFYGVIAARRPDALQKMISDAHEKRFHAKVARRESLLPVQ